MQSAHGLNVTGSGDLAAFDATGWIEDRSTTDCVRHAFLSTPMI